MAIFFVFCSLWMSLVYITLPCLPRGFYIQPKDIGFVQTVSYVEYKIDQMQIEPSALELIMILLNYVACIPVLFSVGCFRYEFTISFAHF